MIRLFIRDDNLHVFLIKAGGFYMVYASHPYIGQRALPIFDGDTSYKKFESREKALDCLGRVLTHRNKLTEARLEVFLREFNISDEYQQGVEMWYKGEMRNDIARSKEDE